LLLRIHHELVVDAKPVNRKTAVKPGRRKAGGKAGRK
jgi:hypothetical protein